MSEKVTGMMSLGLHYFLLEVPAEDVLEVGGQLRQQNVEPEALSDVGCRYGPDWGTGEDPPPGQRGGSLGLRLTERALRERARIRM